ncbi:hypothetical protein BS78_07G092200 [Paspalum vaginatum]|nr:hypothetical protein BS78_07G092200 [Paspalum vaginatum]
MPPGRTVGARTRPDCGEAQVTDYELRGAKNIMRNNQVFKSMGFSTLASICKSTKPKRKEDVREHSGSLYEAEHSDA